MGSRLPNSALIELEQLTLDAASEALRCYHNKSHISQEDEQQLVDSVCRRSPFALTIIGPLLRDRPSRAQVNFTPEDANKREASPVYVWNGHRI